MVRAPVRCSHHTCILLGCQQLGVQLVKLLNFVLDVASHPDMGVYIKLEPGPYRMHNSTLKINPRPLCPFIALDHFQTLLGADIKRARVTNFQSRGSNRKLQSPVVIGLLLFLCLADLLGHTINGGRQKAWDRGIWFISTHVCRDTCNVCFNLKLRCQMDPDLLEEQVVSVFSHWQLIGLHSHWCSELRSRP